MTIFCHFRTLYYQKKYYKPILLAQEVSADPQGPRTTKNKNYFMSGSEPLCYVAYFRGYKLSNDEGQKSYFPSQKGSKFQILSYRSVIQLPKININPLV